jgi:ribonuclease HII
MYFVALGGYRSIAGPVVVCFLDIGDISNKEFFIAMTKDNKRMHNWSAVKKEVDRAYNNNEFKYSYKCIDAHEFDFISISDAVRSGYSRASFELSFPTSGTIDCFTIQRGIPKLPIYNLSKVSCTAEGMLASAVAYLIYKNRMMSLHTLYPMYSWDKNSGMVNDTHMEAILSNGPCEHHRTSAIKNIPNWIAKKAKNSKTIQEIQRYRRFFLYTRLWWGKYLNYQIAMQDTLNKEGLLNLHISYNKTSINTWLVCEDEFFDWCMEFAPSEEHATWLKELKEKELERWKLFTKESLVDTEQTKVTHINKKYLPLRD